MATCNICPHCCELDSGESGKCLVLYNDNGVIANKYYGQCSSVNVTPIEKRPFFHYYPGSKFLSVGFLGCSLTCGFCQNFSVSQSTNTSSVKYQSPQDLIKRAKKSKVRGFAFTYNEPTIHQDYIMDLGHELTIKNLSLDIVLKTNGFANRPILRNLALFVGAMNVDIKGDDEEYQRTCGGTLGPVMEAVEWIAGLKTHLEISYLVLPRQVLDLKYHRRMRDWLASIGSNIPIHILYFYPFHKMTDAAYKPKELLKVIEVFRVKMRNVYVSNVFSKGMLAHRNTRCSECEEVLIDRSLSKIVVHKTECCGKKISSFLSEKEL